MSFRDKHVLITISNVFLTISLSDGISLFQRSWALTEILAPCTHLING